MPLLKHDIANLALLLIGTTHSLLYGLDQLAVATAESHRSAREGEGLAGPRRGRPACRLIPEVL